MTVNWAMRLGTAAVAIIVLSVGSAWARKDEIEPVPAPSPTAAAGKLDMAIGIAGTTDYQSRGITQSDSDPAIQGDIEPSYGLGPVLGDAIVNVWFSSGVDFGTGQGAEIDVAGGIKPKFLGQNGHPTLATCTISMHRKMLVRTTGKSTPKRKIRSARMISLPFAGSFSSLPTTIKAALPAPASQGGAGQAVENSGVYAGAGYQFFEDPNAFEQFVWTAGVSLYWKSFTFDVRYWDTDLSANECVFRSGFSDGCDARVVGTISLDTTWSALFRVR